MDSKDLLMDAAQRPLVTADRVLAGITEACLHARPAGQGNSIAWLVWHAARQMDAQLAHLAGTEQIWVSGGWAERLEIARGAGEIGFGDSDTDVAGLRVSDPGLLLEYFGGVVHAFVKYVTRLSDDDLQAVVDPAYDPPVILGIRLVSVIEDAVGHVAQAAYARGLVEGWNIGY